MNYGTVAAPAAGFWRRFAALFIDGLVLLVAYLITLPIAVVAARSGLYILISLAYYTWGFGSGQTIGCRALNIKIVDEATGGVPGYAKGLGRTLAAYLSAFPLGLGYFWMLWDPKRQTWHDKLAGTLVHNTSAIPAQSQLFGTQQPTANLSEQIARLAELHSKGALTDAEFEDRKRRLLV